MFSMALSYREADARAREVEAHRAGPYAAGVFQETAMGAATIQQKADRVAALMAEQLHVRGTTLSDTLRKGAGKLPKAVRAEARFLETAAAQAQHPKLLVQIDDGRVAQAYDACVRFLTGVDRKARRRAMLAGMASSIAFSLFAVGVLFLAVLYWRGLM
jgi:hypothetical protein